LLRALPEVPAGSRFIAVAALGLDEAAEISLQAAHAPNFLLFDDAGHLHRVIANPHATLHDDVAEDVVELLARSQVRLLIAGDFGPRIAQALDQHGIRHIKDMGLANIAVQCIRSR
jgi:predicted Fe-Mo cluster-binding NifX family protein